MSAPGELTFLSVNQYCVRFGVSRASVFRWLKDGLLASRHVGPRSVRIIVRASDLFEAEGTSDPRGQSQNRRVGAKVPR